jgi:cyclic pyranopterin phosphate synthase
MGTPTSAGFFPIQGTQFAGLSFHEVRVFRGARVALGERHMTVHSVLHDLIEPLYRDRPGLRHQLRAAQAQLNRLRTGAWESFPALVRPHPESIYLSLTAHCNLRCKGCRYGRDFMPGQQLPFSIVRDVLDDAKELKLEVVRLYGGEPLVHKDIVPIVEYCSRLGLRTYLTTNGIALRQKMDDLFAAGLRKIQIGFYGVGEEYDAYVQRKDRFHRLEEGVAYVRERYGNRVSLTLNWVLMRPTCSLESVREMWAFAQRYNASIYVNLVHYSLPYFTEGEDRELQFAPADRPAIEAVIGELMKMQSVRPDLLPMSPIVLRAIPDWLIKGPNMRVPCDRHRLIWVGPDGTVQMCYVTFKLGNLHERRLKDMLFTKEHGQAARDAFALNCPNCHCGFESRTLGHAPTRNLYASAR